MLELSLLARPGGRKRPGLRRASAHTLHASPVLHVTCSSAWQYQPCRPPNTQIKRMIGSGMPRSHNNSPRPMTSSCVASRTVGITASQFESSIPQAPGKSSERHSRARNGTGCKSRPDRYIAHVCRRGGRVAEGARLESVYTGNRIVGSNPTPSARMSYISIA